MAYAPTIRWMSCAGTVLSESATVLEILLHFAHDGVPSPRPYLESIPFDVVSELADTAEKHNIHTVAYECRLEMRARAAEEPLGVLRYAIKHDIRYIAEIDGPHTTTYTLRQCMEAIPEPDILAHWIAYCDRWDAALLSIARIPLELDDLEERQAPDGGLPIDESTHSYAPCGSIYYFFSSISSGMMSCGQRSLLRLDENILKGSEDLLNKDCPECRAIFDDWLTRSRLRVDTLRTDGFFGPPTELDVFVQWARYRANWQRAHQHATFTPFDEDACNCRYGKRERPVHPEGFPVCESAHVLWVSVVNTLLSGGLRTMLDLEGRIIQKHEHLLSEEAKKCGECRAVIQDWLKNAQRIVDGVKAAGFFEECSDEWFLAL